jgi:hypothetical protein
MARKKTNVLLANGVRPFGAETPKGIADQLGGRQHVYYLGFGKRRALVYVWLR